MKNKPICFDLILTIWLRPPPSGSRGEAAGRPCGLSHPRYEGNRVRSHSGEDNVAKYLLTWPRINKFKIGSVRHVYVVRIDVKYVHMFPNKILFYSVALLFFTGRRVIYTDLCLYQRKTLKIWSLDDKTARYLLWQTFNRDRSHFIHIYVLLKGLSQNSVISEAALWMQYQKCQKPQYVRLLWSIPN